MFPKSKAKSDSDRRVKQYNDKQHQYNSIIVTSSAMDQVVATCRGWRDLVNTSLQGLEPVQVIYKLVVFGCESSPISRNV